MTDVFPFVNGASPNVQNKFLEGMPYKNEFPGPFFGKSQSAMKEYTNNQSDAIDNYEENIATRPLPPFAKTFPPTSDMDCSAYMQEVRMFPTFDPNSNNQDVFDRTNTNENNNNTHENFVMPSLPDGMQSMINNYQEVHNQPLTNVPVEFSHDKFNPPPSRSPGGQDLWLNNPQNPLNGKKEEGVEGFKDNAVTDPCNQTGFGKILPEFVQFPQSNIPGWTEGADQPPTMGKSVGTGNLLTDIEKRPVDQFSHNNMVPMYGAKLTQNMRGTGVAQVGDNNSSMASTDGFADQTPWRSKLANFTGCDDMWMHKRETGPMFSPTEQQTGWVFGSPGFRPDLDRYKTDVWKRNNESPIEKIQVGPGIGLDYTVPAAGGLQQFTRVMPNNVNNYKANQLEGRVKSGKWFVNHPTSQYVNGVNQNQPKVEWSQARRPTMPTKFDTNAPSAGDARVTDYNVAADRGKQARSDTQIAGGFGQLEYNSIEMFSDNNGNKPNGQVAKNGEVCVSFSEAPVGMTMGSQVPAQTMDRGSYNTIRETFKRGAAGYNNNNKEGYWECLDEQQGSNRWDLTLGPGKGAVPNNEQRDGWYVNLTDRGDVNPYVINATGTVASKGGVWSPNSYQDEQKTTTKQTTQFSYIGNAESKPKHTEITWSDNPKVTVKETTAYAYHGGPAGNKAYENTWTDSAKVTTKETTNYAYQGGTAGSVPGLANRFMYEGGDNFNPELNSGKSAINPADTNEYISMQDKSTALPLAKTSFVPGLSGINRLVNREDFTTTPNKLSVTEFFQDVKNTISDLFGRNEGYEDIPMDEKKYTGFDPNLFINGSPENSAQTTDNIGNNLPKGQWQKGGVTNKGIRSAAIAWNWFPTPGRSNLIADPKQPLDTTTNNPSQDAPVSSIGTYQTRGTKQVASGNYGPGTLLSANINVRSEAIPSDMQQGYVRQNANRSQFVDYRSTAPFLVDNLRTNPLSIYATRDHVNDPLPEFFNFVKPDNFADYKTEDQPVKDIEKQLYVDGSPQTTILGLYENNPLMGIRTGVPNSNPTFSGKAYSGKHANTSIYEINWQNDFGDYIESFGNRTGQKCQNKALDFASQGYNISGQINEDNFITYGPRNNLPWGPRVVTNNVITQNGGIWAGTVPDNSYNIVNRKDYPMKLTDHSQGTFTLDQRLQNKYKHGLPGSLVA